MTTTNIELYLESRPHRRYSWLTVIAPVGDEPEALYRDLAEIGWEEDERFAPLPPLDGQQERRIAAPRGSGLFGEWTAAEAEHHLGAARGVLEGHGFAGVNHYEQELD